MTHCCCRSHFCLVRTDIIKITMKAAVYEKLKKGIKERMKTLRGDEDMNDFQVGGVSQ